VPGSPLAGCAVSAGLDLQVLCRIDMHLQDDMQVPVHELRVQEEEMSKQVSGKPLTIP
jgi:hypothetical protein